MSDAKSTKPVIALCYDFDGTLSPGNMQEYDFIPSLNIKPKDFWEKAGVLAKKHEADQILCYMKLMLDYSHRAEVRITRRGFAEKGAAVAYFPGVAGWFGLINGYGRERGVTLEHYIISSGIKEIIEGTELGKKRVFKKIYACSYIYDKYGIAEWPANAVNYTTKTQYLFRINKGVEDVTDDEAVNEFVSDEERRVPFSRMIYFGDGDTDIPCMRLVKSHGGYSIAVYRRGGKQKEKAKTLLADGRVNFIAPADYSENSDVHKYTTYVIDKIVASYNLSRLERKNERKDKAVSVQSHLPRG